MDELTRSIQDEVPLCMLFADDIVSINKTRRAVNVKLEIWRDNLDSKGFRLSSTKTTYMQCKFSKRRNKDKRVVRLDSE
jgi:hypothetical protein